MLSATMRQFGEKKYRCTMSRIAMAMLIWVFIRTDSTQINAMNRSNAVVTATPGDNVTLHCFREDETASDTIVWYKQEVGREPRTMVMVHKLARNPVFESEFEPRRFSVENSQSSCHLNIANVEAADEAVYYCGLKQVTVLFGKGTFLLVKNDADVKVVQSGVWDSVPAGGSRATLQCSVLSERTTADLRVLWFRSAPSQSHPQIIYTHHNNNNNNNTDQCHSSTRTCVYNISVNHTGTYYCAVVLCGRIVFGKGIPVQLVESVDPVVIGLTVALGGCVFVISVQALFLHKWTKRGKYTKTQNSMKRQTNTQHCEFVEVNYAALHFNDKKSKTRREKRENPQETFYSEVRSFTAT